MHLSPRFLKVSQSVDMLLGSMATRDACEETLRQPVYYFGAGKFDEQVLAIRECLFLYRTARARKLRNVAHSASDYLVKFWPLQKLPTVRSSKLRQSQAVSARVVVQTIYQSNI